MTIPSANAENPWPHRLAIALAWTTFPLIWVGGLVTTYKAGMAVPDWPTTYGYNLFLYPWTTWVYGPWDLFIEHGHRLLGATVGMMTIALVAAIWLLDSRRWMRALSVLALAAVIVQGGLGGLRVIEDQVLLAKIHGCFGPAFFALSVALAAFTSPTWRSDVKAPLHDDARRLQSLALVTTFLSYLQLVLGAQLRHLSVSAAPGEFRLLAAGHVALALLLVLHVVLLMMQVIRAHRGEILLTRPAVILAGLVTGQIALGMATWLAKYGWPIWLGDFGWTERFIVHAESRAQALITTAHVANGSLILITSLLLALRSLRLLRSEPANVLSGPALVEAAR